MIGNVIPASVNTLAIVVVVLAFILNRTVFGQRLYAIGANPTAARFSGVRSRRDLALTYVITGMMVGLSAVMTIANVGNSNPQAASGKEMDIILAVVLGGTSVMGGKGSVWGTAIGFAFIGFLSNGFTALGLSQYAQWVITGIILVAALSADVLKDKGVKLWKKK
jgi:ribose transport system permease protein